MSALGPQILRMAETRPDHPALVMPGFRMTYGELGQRARRAAAAFRAGSLRPGDRVGLLMENCQAYVELIAAAALSGVTVVLFNTDFPPQDVRGLAETLDVRLMFVSRLGETDHVQTLKAAAGRRAGKDAGAGLALVVVGEARAGETAYEAFLAAGHGHQPAEPNLGLDAPLAVIFTSGVTGAAKACLVTQRTIMCKAAGYAEHLEFTAATRIWLPVPMYQSGFLTPLVVALSQGATVVAAQSFDPAQAVQLMSDERVTLAYPIYTRYWLPIIYHPGFRPSRLPALSHVALIGPLNVLRRAQRTLPQSVVMNMYGSAEEAGAFCLPRPDDPPVLRLVAGGALLPGHEVRVVDPATGAPRPRGVVGEIQVRGEGVAGPVPGPLASTRRFLADGWLVTEDVGLVAADGRLQYHGRLSEMLDIAGETVSAEAIETQLCGHAQVAFAQVIARPDPHLGQVAHAFLELRPGAAAFDLDALLEYCRRRLKSSHIPRYVTVVKEWPVSASKIRKSLLAELPPGERVFG